VHRAYAGGSKRLDPDLAEVLTAKPAAHRPDEDPAVLPRLGVLRQVLLELVQQIIGHWDSTATGSRLRVLQVQLAVAQLGLVLHHCDTGNQFAADDGASLRELMERMGHASPRAAMIYLHVSKARSRHIADRLSARLREARPQVDKDALGHAEGTQTLNEARENGGASGGSRSDLHGRGGGDEGT